MNLILGRETVMWQKQIDNALGLYGPNVWQFYPGAKLAKYKS